MKNLMSTLLLALTVLSTNAFAGNEGPQAAPEIRTPIAEYRVSSGFVPPTSPTSETIQVLSNGQVLLTHGYFDGREEVRVVTTLSKRALKSLKAKIAVVQPGELYDANPEAPMCMDAPGVFYSVYKDTETKIKIAGRVGCKDLDRENATEVDGQIVKAIDKLVKLSRQR